ncbi:suppressor of RPS4-RLD 1 [Coffea eugenioides]|uniref:Suppressor of RPS4-RLD 1 isoform X2 n=1 Tax=Coffea arabica TaxID=13443 RepID=A0A6P6TIQ8_COFAR|nr:suppressor of RPS4-RLD 1-like isoform X2 [Coffea arabica]XP_027152870.1 suppressor of RPS4-RLD 1 [Coffea eugenioides]
MASTVSERIELAKLCTSKDWSKAIRILDNLLAQSCAIQDICNRAFCYSQLELHKHVVKDCDKALQLDPTLLQAYILKGRAFSSLGRREEAVQVWEQGYEHALRQSADLKQLLELEELLVGAKQGYSAANENLTVESSESSYCVNESATVVSVKSDETCDDYRKSNGQFVPLSKSNDQLESCESSNGSSGICNLNDSTSENKKFDNQTNGIHEKHVGTEEKHVGTEEIDDKLGDESLLLGESKDPTQSCIKGPTISVKTSGIPEIQIRPSNKLEMHEEWSNEATKGKKFCVARISKTNSINVDFRLSRGIAQVNEGNYAHAISIFDQILQEDPTYPEALIGRGTAYAFRRELDAAIADFTKAIQSNPAAGEAWKRRGQARAALGDSGEAIGDLTKALEYEPDSEDILHERGIVNFKFKDFNAAVKDLSACVKFDKSNKSAYTYLGLSLSSLGEYAKAEEAHKKAIQLDRSFVEAWAHLAQFYQELANSSKALECLQQLLEIDGRFTKAYHLRGLLLHGMGDHKNAIKELSVGLSLESSNIECLYLRASCHHAIGEYREAVKDYDAALDLELDSMEKFVLQCLAFYQKEIALYTASKLNSEFRWFDIDGDIDPLFKEYWCKRLHPKNVCEKVYRQPPLRDSLRKAKLRKQEFSITKPRTTLLQAADSIGKKIQCHCSGFLANRRQHRMAGLAAIEIAQKVSKAWRSLQAEWKHSSKGTAKSGRKVRRKEKLNQPSQNRGGAGCSTSSLSEISTSYSLLEDRSPLRSTMSWHDVYNLAVKWRQISEPCDPVVWVNKLSEEFNSGFGSHTPLVLGQAKVVRYFPNFPRMLNTAKMVIKERKYVCDKKDNLVLLSEDKKLQQVMNAESCSDLYQAIGDDFWVATWCNSTAVEGKCLEGTRITLVKLGNGFDFAVRTPCTPSRWEDFDLEMTAAWEALCDAYCGETFGSTDFDMLENVREAVLRMTYYWYNFMPLSRGSAAVGFVVLLGLLLAANMEFTGSIPDGLQLDWEAILNFDPNSFMASVRSWLYPSLKVTTSWKGYPDVASTFETTGSVVAALSTYSD